MSSTVEFADEIIVDNFAGGGGASTGIEMATGREVAIAVNHDPDAILMHRTNHPLTEHYQESVWNIDPKEVCKGRPVGLAWFSPDCKHFSKAKGKALRDRNIRGLAWIVLRWAGTVRPRVIMLENVEEFKSWGPVRKGKPVKSKAGETFAKWKKQLADLGYTIQHRELVAADYGAPTSRKRFVLVARCDGKPIAWPERTHAPADSEEVKSGKCKPWRTAAEIIDWSLPCPSIFQSKKEIKERYGLKAVRPLAENTLRRIIRGVDKYTIRCGKPYIVECNHSGDGHVRDSDKPLNTITHKYTGGICNEMIAPITFPNTCNSVGSPADHPVYTVTSAGNQILQCPSLIQYHTEQTENVRASGLNGLLPTVDASNRHGLATANLVEYFSTGRPLDVDKPMHTVTSRDREALTMTHIQKYYGCVVGSGTDESLPTVTAIDHNALCAAHVAEFKGSDKGQRPDAPLRTITAGDGQFGEVKTTIVRYTEGEPLGYWPEIRELLNRHCGYTLGEDEVLLICLAGIWYYIADIGLRMLIPRELYNAMGFPEDYKIERDYRGNEYGRGKQVARCGNAVCPPMAEAVVRANLPEWCGERITTMEQLGRMVAV